MKYLNKILTAIVPIVSSFIGGGTAAAKDVVLTISPGGYEYNQRLTGGDAMLDISTKTTVRIDNYYAPTEKLVSFWTAWFYDNDLKNRSETTYVANYGDAPYWAYSNYGYACVIEIQTPNYFYFLEIDALSYKVALTYNHTGDYPLFYDFNWTAGKPVSKIESVVQGQDHLNIKTDSQKTTLYMDWLTGDPLNFSNLSWTLPF